MCESVYQPNQSQWKLRNIAVCLAVLVSLPYLNALSNGFVWLDHAEILDGKLLVRSWSELWSVVVHNDNNFAGYHRPLYNLAHSLDHLVWGENAFGYHLSSLLLHGANCVLLFYLIVTLGQAWQEGFLVALLWGIHPVNSAVVSLIHSKADLLVTLFLLASLMALVCLNQANRKRIRRMAWLALGSVFYILALLSKESALVFPVIVLSLIAIPVDAKHSLVLKLKTNTRWFLVVGLSLITVVYLAHRLAIGSLEIPAAGLPLIDRLLSFIPVYVDYLTRSLFAVELTTNDAVTVWKYYGSGFWAYLSGFLGLVVLQVVLFIKYPRTRLGLVWFNLFLLPVAQMHPILHFRADRFLYLPSIGFVWVIVSLLDACYEWCSRAIRPQILSRCTVLLLLGCVLALGIRIWARNRDFRNNITLFEQVVADHPAYREAHSILASEYMAQRNYARARLAFRAALAENPGIVSYVDVVNTRINEGVLLLRIGQTQEAYAIFSRLLESGQTTHPECGFNLAVCCIKLGKYPQARKLLTDYLHAQPDNPDGLFLLGKSSLLSGALEDAQAAFVRYLEVQPMAPDRDEVESVLSQLVEGLNNPSMLVRTLNGGVAE